MCTICIYLNYITLENRKYYPLAPYALSSTPRPRPAGTSDKLLIVYWIVYPFYYSKHVFFSLFFYETSSLINNHWLHKPPNFIFLLIIFFLPSSVTSSRRDERQDGCSAQMNGWSYSLISSLGPILSKGRLDFAPLPPTFLSSYGFTALCFFQGAYMAHAWCCSGPLTGFTRQLSRTKVMLQFHKRQLITIIIIIIITTVFIIIMIIIFIMPVPTERFFQTNLHTRLWYIVLTRNMPPPPSPSTPPGALIGSAGAGIQPYLSFLL